MEDVKEFTLELPWNVVDECNGFGLDFGGSVCKVVYIHNDDWAEPDKRTKDSVQLRCVSFSRTEFEKALEYLKPRVCMRRKTPNDKPSVYVTGVGGAQYAKEIQETFDIKTINITELECFFAGFNFILRNSKRGEIAHELDQKVIKKGVNTVREQVKMFGEMMNDAENMERGCFDLSALSFPMEQPFEADQIYMDYKDIFPCFLVMIGSNGGIFVVKEDGTYSFASDMKRAGRTFLGLASLLTKSKSFEEIMEKAEKGDMHPVHEYFADISKNIDTSQDNFYSEFAKQEEAAAADIPGFLFGKTVFKEIEEFRAEDLARSFLFVTVSDLVHNTHTATRLFPQVKHVFFGGGFPNHPLTRDFIVEEWLERDGTSVSMFKQTELANLHFLKHGQHLGALGAYLNHHLKFKVVPEAADQQKQP